MSQLPELNLEPLERILEGIVSGELPHHQRAWVCGSARCVAGWIAEFYAQPEDTIVKSSESWSMRVTNFHGDTYSANPGQWSRQFLGLTYAESTLLFSGDSNFEEILELYRQLKAGERCNWDSNGHYLDDVIIWRTRKSAKALEEGLNRVNPTYEKHHYCIWRDNGNQPFRFWWEWLGGDNYKIGIERNERNFAVRRDVPKALIPQIYRHCSENIYSDFKRKEIQNALDIIG